MDPVFADHCPSLCLLSVCCSPYAISEVNAYWVEHALLLKASNLLTATTLARGSRQMPRDFPRCTGLALVHYLQYLNNICLVYYALKFRI